MPSVPLQRIVSHCDQLLRTDGFEDYGGAFNGLQAGNRGAVTRVAAAVDGSLATVRKAVETGANLLLVHHGLFWAPRHPWVGANLELIRLLTENDLAVYSSHLPLDAHPRLGNNALLSKALGFKRGEPFFPAKGRDIGLRFSTSVKRDALSTRLEKVVNGPVTMLPGGPGVCAKIGVCSGGAGGEIAEAAAAGVDTFITGEGPHWTYALAEELGINVFYAGHYATETFGVRALAGELQRRFKLPWTFIDHPTGL